MFILLSPQIPANNGFAQEFEEAEEINKREVSWQDNKVSKYFIVFDVNHILIIDILRVEKEVKQPSLDESMERDPYKVINYFTFYQLNQRFFIVFTFISTSQPPFDLSYRTYRSQLRERERERGDDSLRRNETV